MDANEFEGLLYNIFSENPYANHIFDMIYEKDDFTISDYVYQYFGITIEETWTCLTVIQKTLKLLNDDSFIFPLEEISHKGGK